MGLVNVDPNLDNAIFDAKRDTLVFIDLDLELRTFGYSLGPALFWWLYSQSLGAMDYRTAAALVSGYREATELSSELVDRATLHLLNFSLMELALPVAFSVYGAPKAVDPFERIEERFACERLIFAERERFDREAGKAGVPLEPDKRSAAG